MVKPSGHPLESRVQLKKPVVGCGSRTMRLKGEAGAGLSFKPSRNCVALSKKPLSSVTATIGSFCMTCATASIDGELRSWTPSAARDEYTVLQGKAAPQKDAQLFNS